MPLVQFKLARRKAQPLVHTQTRSPVPVPAKQNARSPTPISGMPNEVTQARKPLKTRWRDAWELNSTSGTENEGLDEGLECVSYGNLQVLTS